MSSLLANGCKIQLIKGVGKILVRQNLGLLVFPEAPAEGDSPGIGDLESW